MSVRMIKSNYGLVVGDTPLVRVTAYHTVGSVSTDIEGAGTAVLPKIPCLRTTFPRVIGGS